MKKSLRIAAYLATGLFLALIGLAFIRRQVDFPVYYGAGRSLLAGRTDLYAPDFALGRVMDYRYLPVFLVAFYPLWMLSSKAAAYVWYLLSISGVIAGVYALKSGFLAQVRPVLSGEFKIWAVAFFITAQYFVMILHYGNAHILAVSILIISLYMSTRGKETPAAFLMAAAITIKLTPVLLLPYFAVKKRWKYLLFTTAFFILINLAPALYFGFGQNTRLVSNWYHHVIASQEFHEINGPINLSLKGQLRRYMTDVDYSQRIDGDTHYPKINLLSLPVPYMEIIWISLIGIIFIIALIMLRRNSEEKSGHLQWLELSMMLCVMLMAGPLTSKIYFVTLLWPVVCLAGYAFGEASARMRPVKYGLVVLSVLGLVLPLLPGRETQRYLLVIGIDFYVCLLILGFTLYALLILQKGRSQPESS